MAELPRSVTPGELNAVYAHYDQAHFFRELHTVEIGGIRRRLSDAKALRLAVGYHSDNPMPTTPMPQLPWGASGNVKATVPDRVSYLTFQLAGGPVVAESHRALVKFDPEFSVGHFWNIVAETP